MPNFPIIDSHVHLWDPARQRVPWMDKSDFPRRKAGLAELVAIGSLVKGVRRLTQDLPDPDFCLQPGFVKATRMLPEFGLSCDMCCYYVQLGQTVDLVRR